MLFCDRNTASFSLLERSFFLINIACFMQQFKEKTVLYILFTYILLNAC